MNRFATLLTLCLALPAFSENPAGDMWLRFKNGDAIQGNLASLEDSALRWESPIFKTPPSFHLDNLDAIEIPPASQLNLPEGNHTATITLTNGDELKGCLTRVTDTEIGLLTSYAGELSFRRDMVDSLRIDDRPNPIYIGPSGLDGWIQSEEGGWTFESAALVCQRGSSIGREIGRHSKIRVAFEISWKENSRFRLYLHADTKDPSEMTHGYELVCQSQYAYMRKRTPNDSTTIGSSGGIREFTNQDRIRFEILHDLTTGRIRLMVEGRTIDDWQEPAPTPEKMGTYLHFAADQANGTRISRILISEWDGLLDDWGNAARGGNPMWGFNPGNLEPDDAPTEENTPQSSGIRLRNGDLIEGKIIRIADGMVSLKTSFNEFQLPVVRLRDFALRTTEEAANPELRWEPIRRNGDIHASFSDGGRVTFQLLGFNNGTLLGRSQTFGEAAFDIRAFSSLEFNIYPPYTNPKS